MVDLTVVIPCYNGENNIKHLLQKLIPDLEKLKLKWEILFVDDHSFDGSFNLLKNQHRDDNRIKVIRLSKNRGQQNAVYCGIINASGSLVITMDDDLQHPIESIKDLIFQIKQGYDIVYAVNRSRNRSIALWLGTWLNGLFFELFLKKPKQIQIGSYRIMTKELIEQIKGEKRSFIYLSALIFTTKPTPKVFSFNYTPVNTDIPNKTRINLKSRLKLFIRLIKNYGPFSIFTKEIGEPFNIEEQI